MAKGQSLKITIVTVSYNSAATIADTLRSVAGQSHRDIEHIVIDGVSSDATLAVVREQGSHIAQLVSEPDRGLYDAMNKGLALASGDFVGFLNSDDMLEGPQSIALLAAAAARGRDIAFGDLVYVKQHQTNLVVRRWRSTEFKTERLRYGWMPPHPSFYVRRSLASALGGFDTSLRIAADYDFMLRCLTRPGVSAEYIPQVLVRMRLGGASNASLRAVASKSREDLQVIRRHHLGGWFTLACKNLRKLPQFI